MFSKTEEESIGDNLDRGAADSLEASDVEDVEDQPHSTTDAEKESGDVR